jgi:hypothetical protein
MRSLRLCLALPSLAALALLTACPTAPASKLGPSAQHYTVRGEVVRLADEPDGRKVYVRHEAVPDFVTSTGARMRMQPMVMPFLLGPGVAKAPPSPGQKIRLTFGVDWQSNAMELESFQPLPADTALVLGG